MADYNQKTRVKRRVQSLSRCPTLSVSVIIFFLVMFLGIITSANTKLSNHCSHQRFLSPDETKIAFISKKSGKPELWVMKRDGSNKHRVSNLPELKGAMEPVWSPNSNLIAFLSFNLKGHSPLTTTHVWVAKVDGSNSRKITLPKPNARFSTFSPFWVSSKMIRFKALVLSQDNKWVKQTYSYNYKTNEVFKVATKKGGHDNAS